MKKNGFTLIEILAVIVIIGIVSTIGIVSVSNNIISSRDSSVVTLGKNYAESARTMRAREGFWYDPKDGEAIIIPYSQIDGSSIENKDVTGYGDIIPSYCFIGVVNTKNNYSYYINQVDESFHALDRAEYNSVSKSDIISGAEDFTGSGIIELKAPLSSFNIKYGENTYDFKGVRVEFDAKYALDDNNDPSYLESNFNINNRGINFRGKMRRIDGEKIEMTVEATQNAAIKKITYVFTPENGEVLSDYKGVWKTSSMGNTYKMNVYESSNDGFIFDFIINDKVIYDAVLTSNHVSLSGYFTKDNSYMSTNADIKGNISVFDYYAANKKFNTVNPASNIINVNGSDYVVEDYKILYVLVKKI